MKSILDLTTIPTDAENKLPSLRRRNLERLNRNWRQLVSSLPKDMKPQSPLLQALLTVELKILEEA